MEEQFDLSEVKVIDDNGEAQPVEIPQEETQLEASETEEVNAETEVEVTHEEKTEVATVKPKP
jgi:hypothetical protein